MDKRTIRVVCALLTKGRRLFIAERDYGEFKGLFEFPGGKIEPGETAEQAIVREIKEELGTEIEVERFLFNERYEYPSFILDMDCFQCSVVAGELNVEKGIHSEKRWISKEEGASIGWCPADEEVFEKAEAILWAEEERNETQRETPPTQSR